MNKLFLGLFLIAVTFVSCEEREDIPVYHQITDSYVVTCPEPPIEIMSTQDEESIKRGEKLLNCFSIVQVRDNLFYMYYEAFKGKIEDFSQGVYFAYSNDCIHWTKRFPSHTDDDNTIFQSNMMGVSVMQVPDKEHPYRMFSLRKTEDNYGLFMWKSVDGITFEDEKEIMHGLYDTQNVGVMRGDSIKLYVRLWDEGYNRKIGTLYIDLDGEILTSTTALVNNYVYTSGASPLNEKYDILFPTHFVTQNSCNYVPYISTIIVDDYSSKYISCNINDWITEDELWVSVSPGIFNIKGENYISYGTRTWLHDVPMPENGVSKFKLIKIQID